MKERNRPDVEGRKVGRMIAKFADEAASSYAAGFAADGLPVPQRCSTCAFRLGTYPNGCLSTTSDALKCATEGIDFLCHDKDAETPQGGQVCVGWAMLVSQTISEGREFKECPWPFSDEIKADATPDPSEHP